MYETPYDVPVVGNIDEVLINVRQAEITGGIDFNVIDGYPYIGWLTTQSSFAKLISSFNHPIYNKERSDVVIDVRADSRIGKLANGGIRLEQISGPSGALVRAAILTKYWVEHPNREGFYSLPGIGAPRSFVLWVADTIARSTGIDAGVAQKLRLLTAWYYRCLFYNEDQVPKEGSSLLKIISMLLVKLKINIPLDTAEMIIGPIGYLSSLDDYVNAVRSLDDSRLSNVTVAGIYQLLRTSWYGSTASAEWVAVALEYPPTFYAMLVSAISDNQYKKSRLGDIAKNYINKNEVKGVLNGINRILLDSKTG